MDGRATGEVIDESIFPSHWSAEFVEIMTEHANAAADQAMAPFLNAVEQNLPSAEVLCQRVEEGSYADLYAAAWGEPINCSEPVFVEQAHKRIAFAIAVFEASDKVNSFSSRRDLAIADEIATYGEATFPLDGLSDQENLGHDLFYLRPPINCAAFCHSSRFGADGTDLEEPYTSANAGYFNIGVPRNPTNPWYLMQFVRDNDGNIINPLGKDWVDLGLAFRDDNNDGLSDFPDRKGEFRTPTVRNTASKPFVFFVKAYMHNGYFKSLKQVVHFYNTRDMKPVCTNRRGEPQKFVTAFEAIRRGCWPLPEEFGRVDDNQDGVIDENDEPNIFGCDRISDCKVELAEGQTYETYCDDPEADLSIGNMCLTDEEEDALVAYMEALTDQEVMVSPAALDGEDN
jgi:cytochrome c peroxidase